MLKIRKIISGGQTGVDRAAFDFALENNLEIGGFVPKNRRAEDGKISDKYPNLIETATRNYAERTELNVKNSDATLILSQGKLAGGSLLTKRFAEENQKPLLHIDFTKSDSEKSVAQTLEWLAALNCAELNIAGPRASTDPAIYGKTREFLAELFSDTARD